MFRNVPACSMFLVLSTPPYAPLIKQRQLAHLKTAFNDEKFFLLAIKKITPLKSSFSLGYNLRKRIVLILLTAVDLIRRSTPKYYACCVTRQCLFRIHFFAFQSLSDCPTYLHNYIYLLLSSVFVQMQLVRRSLSLSIKIIYNQVLRDKKKEPAVF